MIIKSVIYFIKKNTINKRVDFLFKKKKCLFLIIMYDKYSKNKNLNIIKNRKRVFVFFTLPT